MNMPHTMRLERPVTVKDEEGASKPGSLTVIADNEPCFAQPDNSSDGIEFHRLTGFTPFKVYNTRFLDSRVQDRLTLLTGTYRGTVLNVRGKQRDMGGQGRWFRIDCDDEQTGQHLQSV